MAPSCSSRTAWTAGKMTPLHTHPGLRRDDVRARGRDPVAHGRRDEHRVAAGGLAVAPRGVPHAFLVTSEVARLLCLHTPGCCEAFYRDASEPVDASAPATGVVDFGRVRASAAKNGGIEILGPPPFAAR